jgi:predicted nucleic acid-binding protein
VIDCSFSSALFLPDKKSDIISDFFKNINSADRIYVPHLWWYETNNVLNIAVKRERMSHNDFSRVTDLFSRMRIETDSEYGFNFGKEILDLSHRYNLSSYESVYLELAMRKKCTLMTLDKGLFAAAKVIGIPCGL